MDVQTLKPFPYFSTFGKLALSRKTKRLNIAAININNIPSTTQRRASHFFFSGYNKLKEPAGHGY